MGEAGEIVTLWNSAEQNLVEIWIGKDNQYYVCLKISKKGCKLCSATIHGLKDYIDALQKILQLSKMDSHAHRGSMGGGCFSNEKTRVRSLRVRKISQDH